MIAYDNGTSSYIVYLNHTSSVIDSGYYESSEESDNLSNFMKNSVVILDNILLLESSKLEGNLKEISSL